VLDEQDQAGVGCDNRPMLDRRPVFDRDGITITDVACRHGAGRGETPEPSSGRAIVFVRRGCFLRSADGVESLLDATAAYCTNPGEEQRYDHPHEHGDDCTVIALDYASAAGLWGDTPLPTGPLYTTPAIDLEHRLLLAAAGRREDFHEPYERAITLAADALGRPDPSPIAGGRRSTERARRRLVDGAREALAVAPDRSLPQLAEQLAVSPHHLSRVFRARTGHTISGYRLILRARAGLERIAAGERQLARLAVELGFVDQSHLCRTIRRQTGRTPAALRAALAR
jgi:AraC-like DNA-binding protein